MQVGGVGLTEKLNVLREHTTLDQRAIRLLERLIVIRNLAVNLRDSDSFFASETAKVFQENCFRAELLLSLSQPRDPRNPNARNVHQPK